MVDEINKAMARLDETVEEEVDDTFADYQAKAFTECKQVAREAQEMLAKSTSAPDELSTVSRDLTATYTDLVESSRGALATIESAEVSWTPGSEVNLTPRPRYQRLYVSAVLARVQVKKGGTGKDTNNDIPMATSEE